MEREVLATLVLSGIKGLGSKTFKSLVDICGSAESVLNGDIEKIKHIKRVEDLLFSVKKEDFDRALMEIEKADKIGVRIVPYSSDDYPTTLKTIPDPPPALYVKGRVFPKDKMLAVVGTRKPSTYGRYVVEKIVKPLVGEGVCVVSGMASGIDAISHDTALKEGGLTVAVLGSGVDVVYPPENRKLYERIQESGCVMSELPLGTTPSKYTFPNRNRIIAGISHATFVVEAPQESGSLITAKFAYNYSRPVFTVPGNINMPTVSGNNSLIKEKLAIPITSLEELRDKLPFLMKNVENPTHQPQLSDLHKSILDFLTHPRHMDEILESFNFDPRIDDALFTLLSNGFIREEGGYYYRTG